MFRKLIKSFPPLYVFGVTYTVTFFIYFLQMAIKTRSDLPGAITSDFFWIACSMWWGMICSFFIFDDFNLKFDHNTRSIPRCLEAYSYSIFKKNDCYRKLLENDILDATIKRIDQCVDGIDNRISEINKMKE